MSLLEGEQLADHPEERIIEIEIERLRDFKDHPFRIAEGSASREDSYPSRFGIDTRFCNSQEGTEPGQAHNLIFAGPTPAPAIRP